ncbi:MAG: Tfp pilus assembly protein FimT/FimU [Pyrinomonadaceae bacterium]
MNFDSQKQDRKSGPAKVFAGFTLFELVVTLTVLSIFVLGTIPLVTNAVRRQKEEHLRDALRQMRLAIDEFKRDTVGACPLGAVTTVNPAGRGNFNVPSDPRSRVVIDDCTIFDTENLDRYPPSLDVLVDGIAVRPRGLNILGGSGLRPGTVNATDLSDATEEIKKVYLRELPVDPMTGEKDWVFRSSYQTKDDDSWDDVNVFDVRSASDQVGLNGVKYSEW